MYFKKPTTSADEIAKYFLALGHRDGVEIGPLKLQKLLYYAQSWNLVEHGRLLFKEKIEAWPKGPVVSRVYGQYKKFERQAIDSSGIERPELDETDAEMLDAVWCRYERLSGSELVRMTHHEDPWPSTRGDLKPDQPSRKEIAPETMQKYYSGQLKKANERLSELLPVIFKMAN